MENKIKYLREQLGIKQDDLAKELNVSQATLSNWERGAHEIDFVSLEYLANKFEVSFDFLLCRNQNNEFKEMTQDEKLISLMQKAEKNYGLKMVFDKTADLDDKELDKLSKLIDIIKSEEDW